jgi:hypothetical protein
VCRVDAQREAIFSPYAHLESLVIALRDAHKELASEIDDMLRRGSGENPSIGV